MRYIERDRDIVWECQDGESLLIDLKIGVYYSFRSGTSQLLMFLLSGLDVDETVEAMQNHFQGLDAEFLRERIEDLVRLLVTDGLVVEKADRPVQESQVLSLGSVEFPAVEKYDDMTEIFEMDPIHDGDLERGWPVQTAN